MSSTNSTTSATEAIATTHELTETFGVLLIGFIFTVTLYGLTFFQTYIYYTRFPHDARGIKYTVGLLWALDTALTTLISHTIYCYLITDFMLAFPLLTTTKTFISEEALSVFLALVVQCFYAFRIWTVSGKRSMVPAVIATLALAAFGQIRRCFTKWSPRASRQVTTKCEPSQCDGSTNMFFQLTKAICWGLSVGANILIATSMLWHLRPSANPGMATPDGWYEQIVVYGVNRGTSFAIVQAVSLITIVTMPNQQVWILFHWVGSKGTSAILYLQDQSGGSQSPPPLQRRRADAGHTPKRRFWRPCGAPRRFAYRAVTGTAGRAALDGRVRPVTPQTTRRFGPGVYINSILSMYAPSLLSPPPPSHPLSDTSTHPRLNFRNTHRGRGVPEESSLNAHAHDSDGRSGTITTRSGGSAGQLDTSLSVHFNVPTESKGGGEALSMGIELDLVDAARGDSEGASYGDVDIAEKEKAESASVAAFGGPSKPRDIEEE
ncbi:hypothetical protein VTO73DRAFT_5316 [Trametes versicolor]